MQNMCEQTENGKTVKALPDSARKRKVTVKEIGITSQRNQNSLVLAVGKPTQLPSGSGIGVNDNSEGGARSYSAPDSASFLAPPEFLCV